MYRPAFRALNDNAPIRGDRFYIVSVLHKFSPSQ